MAVKKKKTYYPARWNIRERASFSLNFSLTFLIIQRFVFVTSSSCCNSYLCAPAVMFIILRSFIRKHIVQIFTTCEIHFYFCPLFSNLRGVANMACPEIVHMASCYKFSTKMEGNQKKHNRSEFRQRTRK